MANQILTTNPVTFLDYTDERKLDVYISSNLPTTQIFDTNKKTYSPDWSSTNLVLNADVYLDSKDVTADAKTDIRWFEQIGTNSEVEINYGDTLIIDTNKMSSNALLTYICKAKYDDNGDSSPMAITKLTFTRVDTGINGSDGLSAPAVQAQYSVDGQTSWTATLNVAIHKYIRYSYDGGKTWTTAIKMVGEDGTSVSIKGTATSRTSVSGTSYYTLVYNSATITGAALGDAYLLDGNMYVCVDSRDGNDYFMDVGRIQGPQGNDGQSSYVFIRYATNASGANMTTSPSSTTTHIGICTVNTNVAPTTASSYIWSKFVGDSAKSIILSGDSQVFKVDKTNAYAPSTIKVTAQRINIPTTTTLTWYYNGSTEAPSGVVRNGDVVTITGTSLTTNSLVIKASDGTVEDVFTVYKAFDGTDGTAGAKGDPASMAFLTNENVSFSANANGVITAPSITTNVVAYRGTTKQMPTVGDIITPNGIVITKREDTLLNEMELTISFTSGTNLGSSASTSGTITIPVTSPVVTNLKLSWSKINTGATGATGAAGADAYTVMLTNEAHTFAGDVDHAYADNTTTQVFGYKGATQQSVTITSVNGKTAAIIDTDTGITGLKFKCSELSGTSPTITFTCTEAFTEASGAIPIVVSIGGVSFTRMFNYSIAFKGATGGTGSAGPAGSPATAYWLVASAGVIQKTSTGTIAVTPSTLTFTGKSKTGTSAPIDYGCRWIIAYSTDGSTYTNLYTSTANETSKTITVATTYKTIRVRMYLAGGTTTLLDEQIIPVVSDGAKGDTGAAGSDAYTVILTNESHIFAGNISNAIASSATTQVLAYKGSASQSATIVSVNGVSASTSSTATGIAGLSFSCSALSGTSPTITFTCTTSFVSANGTIPIIISVGGIQFTKIFTYGIAFKGATGSTGSTGTAASLVDITPSAHYFKSTTGKDGTFTPDYIYLYPRFQTVTFSAWQYSVNGGTTWVAASGANGLTISTYNSVANTLRIAKTSTLYTDTVTSISFRCVSSNAAVYDTVSIAKIYDVVDLEIGGRNLLLNSGTPVTNTAYNIKRYDLAIKPTVGEQYTITIKGRLGDNKTSFSAYNSGGNVTLGALNRVGDSDIYQKTFNWTNNNREDLDTSVFIYTMPNSVTTESTIEWIKLEKGNKATDWTPAPEDLNNITFQIYAPNGYLLTNDLQSLTLQTFAYEGSIEITSGATFQWSHLIDDVWTNISGATSTTLTVTKTDVLKAKSYRCVMTYKEKTYTSTITVQDKTDMYNSIMCISSNARGSECYWVLYTLVYSDTSEIDPLLGPISISAPASPVNGDYWYAVDSVNATVQLKKYNGTAWANSTDKQSLTYLWNLVNDGSIKTPIGGASKVQVVSCRDFTATATLICDVSNEVDGVLTQSSLSITDASDPIVSQTEPTSAVDGQIWIKPNTNGSYNMFLWSQAAQSWIPSDMDTRNKVYTSQPSSYSKGDIWITESDTAHSKYLEGTLLQATTDNTTYNENDWSATLKYDKDLDEIKGKLYDLSQYVTITLAGLKIGAVNSNGELSPFTSLFTSSELAFYQNSDKLLTLANNQLTAPRVVVEDALEVDGKISLGNLQFTIETNGSFSFAVTK